MDIQKVYITVFLGFFALLLFRRSFPQALQSVYQPLLRRSLRYLVYPRIFPSRHWVHLNPTRVEVILHTIHWACTATCNAYGIKSFSEAGSRAGQIAIIHLLPLLAFRQLSSAADLFGLSVGSFYSVHRSVGIMAVIQGVIHAIVFLYGAEIQATDTILGILCLAALLLLAFVPFIRRFAYEAFARSHFAFAAILAIALWEHLQLKRRFSRMLLLASSATFLITSSAQYLHRLYRNVAWRRSGLQCVRVSWTKRFGDSLIVELKLSRKWNIVPGRHIYVTFLTLRHGSIFQRHPFMITWWHTEPGESRTEVIYIIIRQRLGWTRRLLRDDTAMEGCCAWIEGPYGQTYNLQEYGTVIMFASGDGIFAQLPLIKSLTESSKVSAVKTRRIKLVWQTEEYHDQLQTWMQSILDDEDVSVDLLDISIHISRTAATQDDAGPQEELSSKVQKVGHRLKVIHDVPDVQSYIQLEMKQPLRKVAITVSGYRWLCEEVRAQTLATGRLNVNLFELDYQPRTTYRYRGGTAA